mmetsp:Transcript_122859/g.342368  ORF Transcript_122859/g.342368 Transcript_122859/m.342368 type:complete len:558 (-) Transcript_122859:141-1814(-)
MISIEAREVASRDCWPERDCVPFASSSRVVAPGGVIGKLRPEPRAEAQHDRSMPSSRGERSAAVGIPAPEWPRQESGGSRRSSGSRRSKRPAAGELERWRKEETTFIKEHDLDVADIWYIVDVRWLQAWKAFVRRDAEFPGPIDNNRLIDSLSGQPRPGLRLIDDYRGVCSAIWSFWHQRYGGGPTIQREKLDLYAVPREELDKTVAVLRPVENLDETVILRRPPPRAPSDASPAASWSSVAPFSHDESSSHGSFGRPGARNDRRKADHQREDARMSSRLASSRMVERERAASVRPRRSGLSREETHEEERRGGSPRAERDCGGGSPAKRANGDAATAPQRGRAAEGPAAGATAARRGKSVPATGKRHERTFKPPKCDKCDGPHETDSCPHFSKPREKHKDAWSMLGKAGKGGRLPEDDVPIVRSARVVSQPGDGSCLFHSLSYGLTGRSSGQALRREIADFIARNPDLEIGDNALRDWISYDSGGNVQSYARQMAGGTWGGAIEMAAFTQMKSVNVHVYEKCSGGYRRISAFAIPNARKTVSVLYQGRAHYDALVL